MRLAFSWKRLKLNLKSLLRAIGVEGYKALLAHREHKHFTFDGLRCYVREPGGKTQRDIDVLTLSVWKDPIESKESECLLQAPVPLVPVDWLHIVNVRSV